MPLNLILVSLTPIFQLPEMYGELKNYKAAIKNYQRAKVIHNNYFQDYNLPYSINLAGEGKFQKHWMQQMSFLLFRA